MVGDGGVAEGGLHQVNGGSAVEGVRGVGNAASSAGKPPDRCQARTAAWRTMRSTSSGFREPPRLREGKRGWSSPASPRNFS